MSSQVAMRNVGGVCGVTCFSFDIFSTRAGSASAPSRFLREPVWVKGSVNEITG